MSRSISSRGARSPATSTTGARFAQVSGPRDGLDGIVAIEATFLPGKCHDFHRHPGQEEVIYVIEGSIEQWVLEREAGARRRATRS